MWLNQLPLSAEGEHDMQLKAPANFILNNYSFTVKTELLPSFQFDWLIQRKTTDEKVFCQIQHFTLWYPRQCDVFYICSFVPSKDSSWTDITQTLQTSPNPCWCWCFLCADKKVPAALWTLCHFQIKPWQHFAHPNKSNGVRTNINIRVAHLQLFLRKPSL